MDEEEKTIESYDDTSTLEQLALNDSKKLDSFDPVAKIVVVGVGGAGNNAVNRMIEEGIQDVRFAVLNTDTQALATSRAPIRMILGDQKTHGLGAGGNPARGKEAAEESIEKIKALGANVVFSQKGVDDLVQHYLAKNGILGYRRLKQSDLEAISKATGATIVGNVMELTKEDLGTAGAVEEKQVGEDGMAFITGCKNPKAITIFVRGGTEHVLEEVERALNDAIRVVGVAIEDGKVVAGAGAPEIELELRLMEYASSVGGREQLAIEKFAKAMEIIPWTLSENAGIDPIDSIIKLKNAHEKKNAKAKYYGIDLDSGEAVDMLAKNVVEPLRVKVQAINSAEEVANMILRIDDVIASRRAPPAPAGGPQGGMPPM